MQAGANGDVQGALTVLTRCDSPWLLVHVMPLLEATRKGPKILHAELPELGTTQASTHTTIADSQFPCTSSTCLIISRCMRMLHLPA